jgi:serine/threonine protein kinase
MSDSSSDPDRHPLDELAETFAAEYRRGEHPSVSDYVRRHPEHADGLREVLPSIALMEKLKRRNTSGNGNTIAPVKLERLGDFRIVREIGRGGMGIVYEAWQESLGRHVALKVLSRASVLDPQKLQRFEREARAAAGLHHTNIVPVFGVGEQEGLHYYIMQFIRGRPLSAIIAELAGGEHPGLPTSSRASAKQPHTAAAKPDAEIADDSVVVADPPLGRRYWSWVADVGRQVADALQHAHRQGVLHRDVKPANLIVDALGIVWVADFGLAKLAEYNDVTRTGDVIGTLQYLAPEGLRSEFDARSDVYALGLTLYELLTLRSAFSEASPVALMRRIAEGGLAPPSRINPHIPRDLETIVMKATARDPASRYASAGELAEDMENFLHDRPVTARRSSSAERLWRWCRRNKAVSTLGALAATCAIAAIIIGWVAYGVTRRSLAAEAARRAQAEAAERRADSNVALSLRSFEAIFDQMLPHEAMPPTSSWDEPGDRPPLPPPTGPRKEQGQDALVLQSVLDFYDRFSQQNSTNQTLEAEAAKAYRRVGEIFLRMGKTSDANAAYRRAANMYGQLLAGSPTSIDFQAGFADAASCIGTSDSKSQKADADIVRRGDEYAERLAQSFPRDPDFNVLLARTLLRRAIGLRQTGELTVAEKALRRSIAIWESPETPTRPVRRFSPPQPSERAGVLEALAELLIDTKQPDEARHILPHVFDELDRPRERPGRGDADRAATAAIYDRLAASAKRIGESDLSARAALRAVQVRQEPRTQGPEGDLQRRPPPRRQEPPP